MFRVLIIVVCLAVYVLMPSPGWGQQIQPSCAEQLAQVQTVLMVARAGRSATEESAGVAIVTLQKQIDALQQELTTLKKEQAPVPQKDTP